MILIQSLLTQFARTLTDSIEVFVYFLMRVIFLSRCWKSRLSVSKWIDGDCHKLRLYSQIRNIRSTHCVRQYPSVLVICKDSEAQHSVLAKGHTRRSLEASTKIVTNAPRNNTFIADFNQFEVNNFAYVSATEPSIWKPLSLFAPNGKTAWILLPVSGTYPPEYQQKEKLNAWWMVSPRYIWIFFAADAVCGLHFWQDSVQNSFPGVYLNVDLSALRHGSNRKNHTGDYLS